MVALILLFIAFSFQVVPNPAAGAVEVSAKSHEAHQQQWENFPGCLSHASGRAARHDLDTHSKESSLAARLGSRQAWQHPLLPEGL